MSGARKLAELMQTHLIDGQEKTESSSTTRNIISILGRTRFHQYLEIYKTHPDAAKAKGINPDQIIAAYLDDQNPPRLVLGDEEVTDDDLIEFVIPYLQKHPEIKTLVLADNQLTDKGAVAILTEVKTLENL